MDKWCLGCAEWVEPDEASGGLKCPSDDGTSNVHVLVDEKSDHRLVDSPWECYDCVSIARRWLRLGKTCASTLAVGGGGGVGAAFLVSNPSLTAPQWLGILLFMQLLLLGIWICALKAGRRLRIGGIWVNVIFPFLAVTQVIQTIYSIGYFPDHAVAAQSSTWWWLVADGIGWAVEAALVRELFFAELLEKATLPVG
jgi:hypothetical protein